MHREQHYTRRNTQDYTDYMDWFCDLADDPDADPEWLQLLRTHELNYQRLADAIISHAKKSANKKKDRTPELGITR